MKKTVAFMPWAGLEEEIKIGNVRIVPYKETNVFPGVDLETKSCLDRCLSKYINASCEPVSSITMCYEDGKDNIFVNDAQDKKIIMDAVNSFSFCLSIDPLICSVASNNSSWPQENTDRFQLYFCDLPIGKDDITIQTRNKKNTVEIDKTYFQITSMAGTGVIRSMDNEMLKLFGLLLNCKDKKMEDFKDNIFRCLEWFKFIHSDSNDISEASRIVMMATVFEMLFEFRDMRNKKGVFVDQIENEIAKDIPKVHTIQYSKNKEKTVSKAGAWAANYYVLRSNIVHGDKIDQKDMIYEAKYSQIAVAELVFCEIIIRKIENKLREAKIYDPMNISNEEDDKVKEVLLNTYLDNYFRFKDLHCALGWVKKNKVNGVKAGRCKIEKAESS